MTPQVGNLVIGGVLVAGVDPGSHGHDGFHRGLAGQVFLIGFGALHALTGGEVTGLVGPVQVDFGAGHELQQLPRSVLLRLRGLFGDQQYAAAHFALEGLAVVAAGAPGHTHFELALYQGVYVGVIQGGGVEHGESALVREQLAHVGGSAGAVGVVGIALIAPLGNLGGDLRSQLAVQVALVFFFIDYLDAVVLVQHLIVPVIPAAKDGAVTLGGAVLVEDGGLLQELFHVVEGFWHFNAFGVGGSLIVVHYLGGDQVGQADLLALIAGGSNQALAEVHHIVAAGLHIGGQIGADALRAVHGGIGGVGNAQRRHVFGRDRAHQLGMDIGIGALIDGRNGDQGIFLGELLQHAVQQAGILLFMAVPPFDGDGLGNGIGVRSLGESGSNADQQQRCQQKGQRFLHEGVLPFLFILLFSSRVCLREKDRLCMCPFFHNVLILYHLWQKCAICFLYFIFEDDCL